MTDLPVGSFSASHSGIKTLSLNGNKISVLANGALQALTGLQTL